MPALRRAFRTTAPSGQPRLDPAAAATPADSSCCCSALPEIRVRAAVRLIVGPAPWQVESNALAPAGLPAFGRGQEVARLVSACVLLPVDSGTNRECCCLPRELVGRERGARCPPGRVRREDPERPLTDRGASDIRRVVRRATGAGSVIVDRIVHLARHRRGRRPRPGVRCSASLSRRPTAWRRTTTRRSGRPVSPPGGGTDARRPPAPSGEAARTPAGRRL
jgi:hypothetical protein